MRAPSLPVLGLRANWRQFALLVLVNAFVGAMVGLERHLIPLIAEREFGIASATAALSFIAAFGLTKAATNLLAGRLSDLVDRKTILVIGWLAALPVPLLIIVAPTWWWIVAANVLLGVNQGLAWSTTVIMKIDLVGPARRGMAMGLNEFAGYLAVALSAFAAGSVAAEYGLRPAPFYLGIGYAVIGLALSLFTIRDTAAHVRIESGARTGGTGRVAFSDLFRHVSWHDRALAQCSQAGLVNNLNDGVAWGLFPLVFAARGASLREIAVLTAIYPATWGIAQLVTGGVSDRVGRKRPIASGMVVQAVALLIIAFEESRAVSLGACALLGVGTALVYPTLLAAVGDASQPRWRATAVGIYRMWRDLGYVAGALFAGAVADIVNIETAIGSAGVITLLSGLLVAARMPETHP